MQGSIQKRIGKHGKVTWTCVVDAPRDPVTGRRKQRRLSAATKRELEALVAKTLHDIGTGVYIEPTDMTVGEYLQHWLDGLGPPLSESTILNYESIVRSRIAPSIGSVPLAKLTPLAVQALYRQLIAAGYASQTVQLTHTVFHAALAQAVRWHMIPRNVSDRVVVPSAKPTEPRVWSADEAQAFLTATEGDELGALWRLTLDTGMRLGEILALRWAEVDLDRATVTVRRTLTRNRACRWVIGEGPKSSQGLRLIALSLSCVAALRGHRTRQLERRLVLGTYWHDDDLVFTRDDGTFCRPMAIQSAFERAVGRAGLTPITFHGLRHTNGTLAMKANIHPKVVQERLGHATIAMTMRYSHVNLDMQREAAARIEDLLGSRCDQNVTSEPATDEKTA